MTNFISNILLFNFSLSLSFTVSLPLLRDLKLWQSLSFSYRSNYVSTCMGSLSFSFKWLDKIACEKFEKDLKIFSTVS